MLSKNSRFFIDIKIYGLNVLSFEFFLAESGDVNLDKMAIFCCLNCISECINRFRWLKNPSDTRIIQT
jgi:hypothetical protein